MGRMQRRTAAPHPKGNESLRPSRVRCWASTACNPPPPLLRSLEWFNFADLLMVRAVSMVYRALRHENAPSALQSMFTLQSEVSLSETPGSANGQLRPPRVKTELARRSFMYRAAAAWNRSPEGVRNARNVSTCTNRAGRWVKSLSEA